MSLPTSLEVFRSNLGLGGDNDADASSDEIDMWRKALLDDVPPAQLRWRSPCAGSSPVRGIRVHGIFQSVETAAIAPHSHFKTIAQKAVEQHAKVTDLMKTYVSTHFLPAILFAPKYYEQKVYIYIYIKVHRLETEMDVI